jgi:hypothetical protein
VGGRGGAEKREGGKKCQEQFLFFEIFETKKIVNVAFVISRRKQISKKYLKKSKKKNSKSKIYCFGRGCHWKALAVVFCEGGF